MILLPFEQRVRQAIQREDLLPVAGGVVVACSGGPDSLALLLALVALCAGPKARFRGVRLHVAHLDHGLRGGAGAADAAFVADRCAALGVPCTIGAVTEAERAAWRGSIEAAAREARYRFLRAVAAEVGAARIALGHTLDDQAETVLGHFLRGSGLDGLAGMRPRSGDIIRPLLGLRRSDTLAYCQAQGVVPRQDATNDDPRFSRNRLRHELLPLLATFQPQIIPTLARNAAVIARDVAFLDAATDAAYAEAVMDTTATTISLRRIVLRALHPAISARVLRRAIMHVGSAKPDAHLNADSLDRLERVIRDASGEPRRVQLATGAEALCHGDHVIISAARAAIDKAGG
jgi:tRNA(Ile)-lysidine synthase